jgi:SNF2 family DNA or RNA helicase
VPDLYQFQDEDATRLAGLRRVYLAHVMGLGKTVIASAAAVRAGVERVLVLHPASARDVWERTWATWGNPHAQFQQHSYDGALRIGLHNLQAYSADLLLLDEAHYGKNRGAKRTCLMMTLANRSERVWMLSGTPFPNHFPTELYPALRAVWPDLLRERGVVKYWDFLRRFCVWTASEYGIKVLGVRNAPEFRELLAALPMLRRLDGAAQLPPLRWETLEVEPHDQDTDWLAALDPVKYAALADTLAAGELPRDDGGYLATLRREVGVAKAVPAVKQIAEELYYGALGKVVVMAYHTDVLNVLQDRLREFGCVRLDGGTSVGTRPAVVQRFQHDPAVRVFLGQLRAAGEAITLTAAHEMVQVEQDWSPSVNVQAARRILRIGQEHPCRVRQCVLRGTIDDAVVGVLRRKMQMEGELLHV